MSGTQIVLLVAVAWALIGVTASVVMGRRGHNAFGWLVVGAVLGPIAIPVAIRAVRSEAGTGGHTLAEGRPGMGTIDVLIGVDGSSESRTAMAKVVELLGERIGRLAMATVLDFDAETRGAGARVDQEAAATQASFATQLGSGLTAERLVLYGRPANALAEHAAANGYELVVVGRRGKGLTKAVLGSTASALARDERTPALIV